MKKLYNKIKLYFCKTHESKCLNYALLALYHFKESNLETDFTIKMDGNENWSVTLVRNPPSVTLTEKNKIK